MNKNTWNQTFLKVPIYPKYKEKNSFRRLNQSMESQIGWKTRSPSALTIIPWKTRESRPSRPLHRLAADDSMAILGEQQFPITCVSPYHAGSKSGCAILFPLSPVCNMILYRQVKSTSSVPFPQKVEAQVQGEFSCAWLWFRLTQWLQRA